MRIEKFYNVTHSTLFSSLGLCFELFWIFFFVISWNLDSSYATLKCNWKWLLLVYRNVWMDEWMSERQDGLIEEEWENNMLLTN